MRLFYSFFLPYRSEIVVLVFGIPMIVDQSVEHLNHSPKRQTIKLSSEKAQEICFSPEVTCIECHHNILYVGTSDSKVMIYEIEYKPSSNPPITLQYLEDIYPHCSSVDFIEATEAFLIMIPREEQQLIRIWRRVPLQIIRGFRGHQKQITSVVFMKDGVHLASSSHDATVRIWNIFEHGESNKEKVKYQGQFPILALSEIDESNLIFGGDGCFITLWNWKKQEIRCKTFGHPGSVLSVSYYHPFVVTTGGDSKIKIWQINEGIRSNKSIQLQVQSKDLESEITELHLRKQIKDKLRGRQFCFNLWKEKMLLLDSQGQFLFIDSILKLRVGQVTVDYSQEIMSAKIWKNYLMFVCTSESDQIKPLHIYCLSNLSSVEGESSKSNSSKCIKLDFPTSKELIPDSEGSLNSKKSQFSI